MPSNIRPKDFENYLPEETDTVAQGLVKFVRFAILFWRWFRSEFKTDGSFGQTMKAEMCVTGCTDSDVVPENPDDRDSNDEDNNKGDAPPIIGDPPPVSIDNPECCKIIYDYGRERLDPEEFDEWDDFVGKDLDFKYFKGVQAGRQKGIVDLFCDDNRNKVVALHSRRTSTVFTSNRAWSDAVRMWTQSVPTHVFDNLGTFTSIDGQVVDLAVSRSGDWGVTEVVIYGTTDAIDWPAVEIRSTAKITGEFQTNPGLAEEGAKIPFLINTSGNWCVRLIIYGWQAENSTAGGWSGRSFKFSIDGAVARRYYPAGHKGTLWWGNPSGKQYLTKVNGIRISNVNHLTHSMINDAYGGRKVAQFDGEEMTYVVYDERWQNENPCYVPWAGLGLGQAEALAFQWARDASGMQAGHVYTPETVNLQKITYDTLDPKRDD
tara:strand:+ start:1222 stop:2520 length:1299 start_codon:yes stop_codon:yes gene_type:complete